MSRKEAANPFGSLYIEYEVNYRKNEFAECEEKKQQIHLVHFI